MIPAIYEKVFKGLLERTKRESINWFKGTKPNEFLTTLGNFTIVVFSAKYFNASTLFVLFSIRDNEGEEIDTFSVDNDEEKYEDAVEIFNGARRSALQINKAIEEMEKELGIGKKDDDIGF